MLVCLAALTVVVEDSQAITAGFVGNAIHVNPDSRGAGRARRVRDWAVCSACKLYVLPGDPRASLAAEKLRDQLGECDVVFDAPATCNEASVFFGEDGRMELLREKEKAGAGFRSDLPDVLQNLCSSSTLQRDPLVKSLGKNVGRSLSIVDATGGFGHDSLRMACSGHNVTCLERDPVVYSFLADSRMEAKGGSLHLLNSEAMSWLRAAVEEDVKVDIVYLDPMFPSSKHKSALPKRRMQWLREYLGPSAAATPQAEQEELQQLLDAAKRVAKKVVIKRADDGPVVSNQKRI
ncbi:hypothetical protein GUITHDRAFT_149340 [Guillardia theta CCMP2712]|uniref:SAM-dependent MTase RsmB/NOP-type domain-containing protein n=1 Tax=Guillardia theta (strain CCMP2712) TaxID=905079 RepID=L1I696_GUITC|nr:hypothetical protein GUITHDRAFT_149340 [Guillardia theta CCMP2712]EKX31380.1 hypothetical protein GUITHDRAFT_149340 [Guillardia theta CCMP2712]|eukprot:XP_005818360.1 hypothetical protein GUITHDRAFT_149340 [Guillardia theta CCMP2712]